VNWAFSDESERGSLMLLGLMTVSTAEVVRARKELRTLLMPGQRRVHTAKESPPRRRQLLDVVGGLNVEAVVFRLRRPARMHRNTARGMLIQAACAALESRAITNWVLADQEPVQAERGDARSITRSADMRTFRTIIGRATTSRCSGQSTQSSGLPATVDQRSTAFVIWSIS
jgi:hypothetical protein